jgi:hypothetical protein
MSLFVGLSAGFASSLLVLSPVGGSTFAVPLTMVTPLPIIIGALGWGTFAASGGVLAGILMLLAVAPGLTVYFACFIAPPALIGSHLLGLARPRADAGTGTTTSRPQWFPLGHVLVVMAAAVALGSALVAVATGFDPSAISPERAHAIASAYVDAMSEGETAAARADLIATFEPSIALTMKILPFAFVATWTLIFAFNFALAYWISLKSGNLVRPTEDLTAIDIPRAVTVVAVVAFGLAATGHLIGAVASAIAGAAAGLLLIGGLAVVHTLTRRLSFRLPLLVLIYLFLTLLSVPILILGALEPYLRLRNRTASGR